MNRRLWNICVRVFLSNQNDETSFAPLSAACECSAWGGWGVQDLHLHRLTLPLCLGGRGGVRVLLQEALGAVSPKVQEAAGQQVRVGARERGGGVLAGLLLVLLGPLLVQGQRGQRDHAARQRGELRLAALAVVLPGFERGDGVWRSGFEGGGRTEKWEELASWGSSGRKSKTGG